MKFDPIEITGLTLIEKVIDFKAMTPNREDWSLEKQKNNEPRFVRLQQLQSLISLFLPECTSGDLRGCLESVLKGEFLQNRKKEMYLDLFLEMDALIASTRYKTFEKREWDVYYLEHNYKDLLRLKIEVMKLVDYNSGMMEISYPYLYSYIVAKELSEKINIGKIDSFLWTVVDPAKRVFTIEQLIEDNNYPDRDLFDIDIDWM